MADIHNNFTDSDAPKDPAPTPVAAVGDGFNSFFQTAMPLQLKNPITDPLEARGNMALKVCSTIEEVYAGLGMSSSLKVGVGFGTFQARVDFAKQVQTSSRCVTILVYYGKVTGGKAIHTAEFAEPPSDALELYSHGGDSYVSSVHYGGFYVGSFNYEADDESTYQDIKAQAKASFSGVVNSLNAQFSTDITNITKSTKVTSTFHQSGVGFSDGLPTDMNGFITFMNTFSNMTLTDPEVLDFTLTSYSSLKGCPASFKEVVDGYARAWVGIDGANDHIPLGTALQSVQENQRLLDQVTAIYRFYGCLDADPELAVAKARNKQILDGINTWRSTVDKDPTKPGIEIPQFVPDDFRYPVAKFAVESSTSGPEKFSSEQWFADIATSDILQLIRPKTVVVQYKTYVAALMTVNSLGLGGDKSRVEMQHGESVGQYVICDIDPSDIIRRAGPQWWSGDEPLSVRSILIDTDKQHIVRLGEQETPPDLQDAIWTKEKDTCMVGFGGLIKDNGNGTNMVGLYVQFVRFFPCVWVVAKAG